TRSAFGMASAGPRLAGGNRLRSLSFAGQEPTRQRVANGQLSESHPAQLIFLRMMGLLGTFKERQLYPPNPTKGGLYALKGQCSKAMGFEPMESVYFNGARRPSSQFSEVPLRQR
ncbi:MAG: hypothetical protein ACLFVC_08875, partial [Opitutales bacterium]